MKQQIESLIIKIVESLKGQNVQVELTRPDEQFGDFSTNVAFQLAPQLSKSPKEIAQEIADKLTSEYSEIIAEASVAGPGFINLTLTTTALLELCNSNPTQLLKDQIVVAEYSDANPFKVLHAGHFYTSVIGDVIANLMQQAGAQVHRVNFGGDVGMHVAKNVWAIINNLEGENPDKLNDVEEAGRAEWLSDRYVEGNQAFEEDEVNQGAIKELNKRIYEVINNKDHDSPLAKIYWTCRQWSYDYFDAFYKRINIGFERYYPESEVMDLGLQTVRDNMPEVYQESDGAVIFKGEKYGLFTNVFINSHGLPTYSAKDVGLIIRKWEDYHFTKSLIITSNEQSGYMQVVQKSVEQFRPELTAASVHLTHGVVKLAGGVKMSSRLGNFLKATDILEAANEASQAKTGTVDEHVTVGAVKYAFLKQRIGGDIVYDPQESVSIEGNSGPYLQYAHARAKKILTKAGDNVNHDVSLEDVTDFTPEERALLRKISEYAEIVDLATSELKPHHICTYIYELAQTFNRFYENSRVIGDPRQDLRLKMISIYIDKLSSGLSLLGIASPDEM
jgi:arginyl-tRNA synthetase